MCSVGIAFFSVGELIGEGIGLINRKHWALLAVISDFHTSHLNSSHWHIIITKDFPSDRRRHEMWMKIMRKMKLLRNGMVVMTSLVRKTRRIDEAPRPISYKNRRMSNLHESRKKFLLIEMETDARRRKRNTKVWLAAEIERENPENRCYVVFYKALIG